TGPVRWACRPSSSGKASKIANEVGPIRSANHAAVPGSSSARSFASRRNCSTSSAFPGFASNGTYSATLTMAVLLHRSGGLSCAGGGVPRAAPPRRGGNRVSAGRAASPRPALALVHGLHAGDRELVALFDQRGGHRLPIVHQVVPRRPTLELFERGVDGEV